MSSEYVKELLERAELMLTNEENVRAIRKFAITLSNSQIFCIGVGKSGSVAEKFAASLMSIGFDARYLDPNTSMHGDIGAVRRDPHARKVIFAITNTGKTAEIVKFLEHLYDVNIQPFVLTAMPIEEGIKQFNTAYSRATFINTTHGPIAEFCKIPTISLSLAAIMTDFIIGTIVSMFEEDQLKQRFAANHPCGGIGQSFKIEREDSTV
jgi:D-arabinose 5-phosphate isomerase GutQ